MQLIIAHITHYQISQKTISFSVFTWYKLVRVSKCTLFLQEEKNNKNKPTKNKCDGDDRII